MSKTKCIIIEDEPLAAKVLKDYISEVSFLDLQGVFKDALLATEYLRENKTDLIFLDIHLPRLKGMSFLKTLINPPAVIITTAYHEYAVEGFEMNVTDYLLKPFSFERFLVAVNKIKGNAALSSGTAEAAAEKDCIFINVQKKKVKVLFNDILFIESQREYVKIVTTSGELMTKLSTQEIESMLPAKSFRRVHRSFIVAVSRIRSFTSESIDINGADIPVGRGYRSVIDDLG